MTPNWSDEANVLFGREIAVLRKSHVNPRDEISWIPERIPRGSRTHWYRVRVLHAADGRDLVSENRYHPGGSTRCLWKSVVGVKIDGLFEQVVGYSGHFIGSHRPGLLDEFGIAGKITEREMDRYPGLGTVAEGDRDLIVSGG